MEVKERVGLKEKKLISTAGQHKTIARNLRTPLDIILSEVILESARRHLLNLQQKERLCFNCFDKGHWARGLIEIRI